jgi:hypothetical protein
MVLLNVSRQKIHEKKFCSSFSDRNNLDFYGGRPCRTNWMGANFFSVKVPHIITVSYS